MTFAFRPSLVRAAIGTLLGVISLVVVLFVLPGIQQDRTRQEKAAIKAREDLNRQLAQLKELQDTMEQIRKGQQVAASLETAMPKGTIGELQWVVNKTLHQLAKQHNIRLQSVRYSPPGREGAKGTDIENLDVEFQALGVYASLKKFMLAVEGSGLPFGVSASKLEESPEGARQTVTLRAFRRSTGPKVETSGEDA